MEDQEIVQTFLIESAENLVRLDQEMVALERQPQNRELLASVFRTIHTIKGTCGFFGYTRLERIGHVTENILSELRDGRRELDGALTTLILESIDAIKRILVAIESGSDEGEHFEGDLLKRLDAVLASAPVPPAEGKSSASSSNSAHVEPSAAESTLRVDVGLLDRLMNLVGELVLTRNQLLQFNIAREDATLTTVSQRLNLITTELQESVMKTRMQPIGVLWNKLPRMVRDIAASLEKDISLEMVGAETELDRTLIEAFKDPLTHLVRNSCDHGIEGPAERTNRGKPAEGRLSLRAYHEGGQVIIEIADDGAGIDPARVRTKAVEKGLITPEQSQQLSDRDAIQLIFLPGFSTAATITSVSGRGVGMDVVRTHIERVGGAVDLISTRGEGTTVRVKIPLTLAIIPGLVVEAGGDEFVIPQVTLRELIRLEGDKIRTSIEHIHSTPVYRRRNTLLPLVDLCEVLRIQPERQPDEVNIAVLENEEYQFGLVVDRICDTQEIVVKPLGQQLKDLNCYAGATIMGDGRIALILDMSGIAERGGVLTTLDPLDISHSIQHSTAASGDDEQQSVLLFRSAGFERLAVPLNRVARLEEIPQSRIEWASGQPVVQYRGRVLPLVSLAGIPKGDVSYRGDSDEDEPVLHVVVLSDGHAGMGLVVDEILDIIEDTVTQAHGSSHASLAGSAVVGGRVTDFLDLEELSRQTSANTQSLARLEAVFRSYQTEEVPA